MISSEPLGKQLQTLRKRYGLSISEFATRCDVDDDSLTQWESGHLPLTIEGFADLLHTFTMRQLMATPISAEQEIITKNRLLQQQQALTYVSNHEFVRQGHVAEAIKLITETLAQVLGAEFNGVWLFNENKTQLVPMDEYSAIDQKHDPVCLFDIADYPELFKKIIASDRRNFTVGRASDTSIPYLKELEAEHNQWHILSMLQTALLSYGDVIGFLSCDSTEDRIWHTDEISFQQQMADLVVTAIRNEQYIKFENQLELQKKYAKQQQKAILDIMRYPAVVAGDIKPAFDFINQKVVEILRNNACTIWQIDQDPHVLEAVSCYEMEDGVLKNDLSSYNIHYHECPSYFNALSVGRILVADDTSKEEHLKEMYSRMLQPEGLISTLDAGVYVGSKLVGAICADSITRRAWSMDEQRFLGEIGDQIAQCIINKERKQAEHQLQLLSRAVEHSASAIVIADTDNIIQYCNPCFSTLTGITENKIIGSHIKDIPVNESSSSDFMALTHNLATQCAWRGEIEIKDAEGNTTWTLISASPVYEDSEKTGETVLVCENISQIKDALQQLEQMAFYDTLTGLANRRLFREKLISQIEHSKRHKDRFALFYMDLDRFKEVNDTLGHDIGDELLKTVAQRLRDSLRATDTISRLGGDEFTVILSDVVIPSGIEAAVKKIMNNVIQPLEINGHTLSVSASIGISLFPDDSLAIDELIKKADTALYQAKAAGRNCHRFYKEG